MSMKNIFTKVLNLQFRQIVFYSFFPVVLTAD
jgi:hypothetical protein